jgi:hypothetical protein
VILYILEGKVRHEFGPGAQASRGERSRRFHLHQTGRAPRSLQHERH